MSKKYTGQTAKWIFEDKAYLERETKKVLNKGPRSEFAYARELFELGKKVYFEEYFNDIKLENQIITPIGPFEHPEETFNFKKGYERGAFLVEKNIVPEEYKNNNKFTK